MGESLLLPRGPDDFEHVERRVEHDRDEKFVLARRHAKHDAADLCWTDPVFGIGSFELDQAAAEQRHPAVDVGDPAAAREPAMWLTFE